MAQGTGLASADQGKEPAFAAPGTGPVSAVRAFVALASVAQAQALVLGPVSVAQVLVPVFPVQELVPVPVRAFPARAQVPVRELAFPARELAQVPGQASQAPGTVGTVGTDPQPAVPVPRTDLQSGSGS